MADIEKARKEVKKAEALLIGRFGNLSQVLAHLTRAVGHLIPDEAPQVHPEQPVSTEPEPETVTTVADTEDATPEPESGTEGPAADTMNEKPKRARTSRRKRGKA